MVGMSHLFFFQPFLMILVQPKCCESQRDKTHQLQRRDLSSPCQLDLTSLMREKQPMFFALPTCWWKGIMRLCTSKNPSLKTSHSGQMTSWTKFDFLVFSGNRGKILTKMTTRIAGISVTPRLVEKKAYFTNKKG